MINIASINLDWMVIITIIALLVSICAFLSLVLNFISNYIKSRKKNDAPLKTFDSKLLYFTICLTTIMVCHQFVSELYGAVFLNSDTNLEGNFPEKIFILEIFASSFAGTLKSFGADDNFLSGIENIKLLLQNVFETNDMVIHGYSIIASVVAICAPITGATIFFEILANFFPKLKFWALRYCCIKKKYYFSELNERSLALAKSISKSAKVIHPAIIFTDAYADKTQESTTEFLAEAKRIGAICLRDDITHLQKRGCGQRRFFLIDDNEVKNLQTLTNLTDKFNHKSLKKSEVYLFCQDLIYMDIEKQVRKKLEKEYGYGDKKFTIIPVRCYRNLITNMLEKTPLYEPVVHKVNPDNPDEKVKLNVTILGVGDIGREMFLTTYWMGQMLNCELNINVISKEPEEEFWGKIDYINPEIRYTTYEKHEILRVYKEKDEFSDTYCKVKYFSCDIQSDEFRKLLEREDGRNTIFDTHYFLVSLGSDQLNLSVANTLKKYIMTYHIEHKDRDDKTIINYVVYNADLSSTLNDNPFVCSYSEKPDIYMQAVGGVEQNYNASNIFMTDYYEDATGAAKSYDSRQGKKQRKKAYKNRLKSEYEYWSNLALRLHFKYKVFSVYPFKKSIFDDELEYKDDRVSTCKKYVEEFRKKTDTPKKCIKKKSEIQEDNIVNRKPTKYENRLQWLEHRRWNAFLRTMGYRYTKDYNVYLEYTHGHKQMEAKLHPCLVECNKNGIYGEINDMGDVVSYISHFVSQEHTEKIEENKQKYKKEEQKKAEQAKLICKLQRCIKEKIDEIKTKIEELIKENDTKEENKIIGYDRERIKNIIDFKSLDCLDELSYDLLTSKATKFERYKDKDFKPYDFKQYDYPNNKYLDTVQFGENDDLINYISVKTASKKYKVPRMLIRKLCEKGMLDGAVKLKNLGIWMIPKR